MAFEETREQQQMYNYFLLPQLLVLRIYLENI